MAQIANAVKSIPNPKLPTPKGLFSKSTKYVIGEKRAKIKKGYDNSFKAIKIPLIKINGNFTSVLKVIIFEVISVGGTAINTPSAELAQENSSAFTINHPKIQMGISKNINKMMQIIEDNRTVNIVEASTILNTKSNKVIGAERILSRFFSRVSHGKITGLIEVLIKNTAIPKTALNNWIGSIDLPITHASIIKKGNNNPKMITGPFLKYSSMFFFVNTHI